MADLHIFGDSYSVDWDIHRQKKHLMVNQNIING